MFQHVSSDGLGAVENPSAYRALIFSFAIPHLQHQLVNLAGSSFQQSC
jgi:hypothetical protein